jgi:hypothetical protein
MKMGKSKKRFNEQITLVHTNRQKGTNKSPKGEQISKKQNKPLNNKKTQTKWKVPIIGFLPTKVPKRWPYVKWS